MSKLIKSGEEARKALSSEPDGAAAISRDVPVARASHSEAKGIPVAALVALRERLAAQYAGRARVHWGATPEGFAVEISLPFETTP